MARNRHFIDTLHKLSIFIFYFFLGQDFFFLFKIFYYKTIDFFSLIKTNMICYDLNFTNKNSNSWKTKT